LEAAGAIGVSIAVGLASGSNPIAAVALFAGLAFVAWAAARPLLFFAAVLATLPFLPVYASPLVGNASVNLSALGFWLVAVRTGVFRRHSESRLTSIDAAVLGFFAIMTLPVAVGVRSFDDYLYACFLWAGPYLAGRLVLTHIRLLVRFVKLIAGAALLTLPFVLYEYLSGSNLFLALNFNPKEAELWTQPVTRLGENRVAGAMGHPLALSMFLASASLICFALWLGSQRPSRAAWLVAALVIFAGQSLTLSRTGWIMFAVGVALLAVIYFGPQARLRLSVALGVTLLIASAALSMMPAERSVVTSIFGSGPGELPRNADYRRDLALRALEPGVLAMFGERESAFRTTVQTPSGPRSSPASLDNNYVYLADRWGLVTLAGFLLIAMAVVLLYLKHRRRAVVTVLPAVVLANLAAFYFVAFITQQQVLFWVLLGACGALSRLDSSADQDVVSSARDLG
jgi:hypothetical protein